MSISITSLDHLVLTVRDLEKTCRFYEQVLGMKREMFGEGRLALTFGRQKINLHAHPTPHQPLVADVAAPGTADLCFLAEGSMADILAHLDSLKVPLFLGPVPRTGAQGPITSVYVRDPDQNLIEISVPTDPTEG
ncbi:VOC family protein [Rhodovibrionaceae bacterium A322]